MPEFFLYVTHPPEKEIVLWYEPKDFKQVKYHYSFDLAS